MTKRKIINPQILRKAWNNLKWLVLVILVAIIGWVVKTILDQKTAGDMTDKYIAVVITNKSDATFTIPEEFRKGFGTPANFKSSSSSQNIYFEKFDDFLSDEQAEIIANKLLEDENCVLIIGNSTSSLTEVTLNSIISSDFEKPGFILPIATADNIIEKAKDQNYKSILRMMPNNDEQATTIKNFIFHKFNSSLPKVAILSDQENTTYSHNLSQKIADKIQLSNGKIVMKKDYGNSNRLIEDYELLKRYNLLPDIIVFVGISSNGSLLKQELKSLKIDIPVIFTDGCTVKNLMDKSKKIPHHYFISAVEKPDNENEAPTYKPVGVDARDLGITIINNIKGNITRKSISDYIQENKDKIILEDGASGRYGFNQDGDNEEMNWKVYAYQNLKLTLVYSDN